MPGHAVWDCMCLRIGTADALVEQCPFTRVGGVAEDRPARERMLIQEAVSHRRSGYAPRSFLPPTYPPGTFLQPAAPPPARIAFPFPFLKREMLILTAGANFQPREEVFWTSGGDVVLPQV